MKKPSSPPSFSWLLIKTFLLLTLALAVGIFLVQYLTNRNLDKVLPEHDVDGLIDYIQTSEQDELTESQLFAYLGENAFAQIYDIDGQRLFSSPQANTTTLTPRLLDIMPADLHGVISHVVNIIGDDGNEEYMLTIESSDGGPGKLYRLNQELEVIDSSESDWNYFTKSEIEWVLLKDVSLMGLIKHDYVNALGQQRTLVFAYPTIDEAAYAKAFSRWRYAWVVLVVVYLLMIMGSIFWLNRKTQSLLEPLGQAITRIISNQPAQIDYTGPREFMQLYARFNALSEDLQLSERERKRLDANRRKMLADISHDLKTPITVIQGYALAIQNDMVSPDKQQQYLATIYQKSLHLTKLIDNFFEYSRLQHPSMVLQTESTDLVEFMQSYLAEKYQEIELADFGLEVSIPENLVIYYPIDALQMRRAFDNLISNSLRYNPPGTTIYFSLQQTDAIEMIWADDGLGLPDHLKGQLFEAFAVGDESRGQQGGTGLGLAITEWIIGLHGGSIELVDPPEAPYHTQFRIRLKTMAKAQ